MIGVTFIPIDLQMETVRSLTVFGGEAQSGEQGTFKRAECGADATGDRAVEGLDGDPVRPVTSQGALGEG